ncbi:hypothetical protein BYT27DRAFT_7252121 [Phlegmacium glaucopus]|nr:hypothetical protein BYT27DRAFT_7252121 [Phlegmacium glaucopus]
MKQNTPPVVIKQKQGLSDIASGKGRLAEVMDHDMDQKKNHGKSSSPPRSAQSKFFHTPSGSKVCDVQRRDSDGVISVASPSKLQDKNLHIVMDDEALKAQYDHDIEIDFHVDEFPDIAKQEFRLRLPVAMIYRIYHHHFDRDKYLPVESGKATRGTVQQWCITMKKPTWKLKLCLVQFRLLNDAHRLSLVEGSFKKPHEAECQCRRRIILRQDHIHYYPLQVIILFFYLISTGWFFASAVPIFLASNLKNAIELNIHLHIYFYLFYSRETVPFLAYRLPPSPTPIISIFPYADINGGDFNVNPNDISTHYHIVLDATSTSPMSDAVVLKHPPGWTGKYFDDPAPQRRFR